MNISINRKQQGMAVLTMILLVVILLSVIGAVVATSRTAASSTADQSAKLLAAGLIDQGNTQKIGVDLMTAKGSDIDNLTFDTANNTGLFNANTGGTIVQSPPSDSISAANAKWLWAKGGTAAKGVKMPLVGTGGSSYAVLLPNVKDSVCRQLNLTLRSYDPNTGIPDSGKAAPTESGTTGMITAEFDLGSTTFGSVKDTSGNAVTQINGYSVCVKTSDGADKNVYVNIVKPI